MDKSCATITAPQGAVTSLLSYFERKKGFCAKQIDLQGRFHCLAHQASLERLLGLCASLPMLQLPNHSHLRVPVRRNDDGELLSGPDDCGDESVGLHEVALRCILVKKADWYTTVQMSTEAIDRGRSSEQQPKALLLGPVDCMPHSVPLQVSRPWVPKCRDQQQLYTYPDHAIAIVGASGRFPGSETLEAFWETIRKKDSKIGAIPEQRGYRESGHGREDAFMGNYLAQGGSFDHAFFRKSPREASYMDPQHRLALHLAYEALESSGYFSPSSSETKAPEDVGCYIGISSADYQDNVNCQPPTAFSFTGTARAFAPGRISHFFGWTGPSMAVDTACSSSMVAMHTAVRAVQSGECSMALAGGLNLITSPKSHQSLGGASFLSPSGQCCPFDAEANGYCRGEGAGFVLVKRLSAAVADSDRILGVIVGSATNNSRGNTSITVPSSDSQSDLYRRVLQMAGMQPSQVSYVEAHGTGTQKGDPVECASIQKVFGGAERRLRFGSVKGNIGHSESASGVASLIKVLLMLQHGQIPPQANLSVLNPALGSLEDSNMEIPQHLQPWDEAFRAACVNNYGASGSNAAMIVCQPPPPHVVAGDARRPSPAATCTRYPFLVSAHSGAALRRYCRELVRLVEKHDQHLPTLAFNLAQKQNHALGCRTAFQAASLTELKACITDEIKTGEGEHRTASRPVVLVFAGQTGHRSRLSQEAYHGSLLLQRHLDRCDRVLQSMGLRSLFPHIFGDEPIEDLVDLHCMQFSVQYAAASAWIDAGLEIKKVIGHSLGQLTAMCVAGAVSLRDGLKMVSGRAALIQTNWGPERGCMLSVDADIATVRALLTSMPDSASPDPNGDKVEIACYNSASNHIVVGSEAAIARLEDTTRSNQIRSTRLAVTHGFHSRMVDSIMDDFSELVRGIQFSSPRIPLEPCANLPVSWADITPEVVARQSREPVYFSDAVARVERQLGPSCIWLEAGSGPIGVTMVRRALESLQAGDSTSRHSFHSIRLHIPEAIDSLAATTVSLWKEAVRVQFWPYHAMQRGHFGTTELPPYQFETSHHWLPITSPVARGKEPADLKSQYKHLQPARPETSSQLVSFLGLQYEGDHDGQVLTAAFSINQHAHEYSTIVHGRAVLGLTLAPSSLWLESATRALRLLSPTSQAASAPVQVDSVKLHAGFGRDLERGLRVTLRKQTPGSAGWGFVVESHDKTGHDTALKLHASGTIRLQEQHDKQEASRSGPHGRMLHRLIDYKRCLDLRGDPEASLIQGTFVRKLLSQIATYTPDSFGIRSIATRDAEAVAQVTLPPAAASALGAAIHPLVHDNCLLVAEMHASNLEDCPADEVYICHALDAVVPMASGTGPWTVYSKLHRGAGSSRSVVSDIFVFDDLSKTLAFVILGASFYRISTALMEKNLNEMVGSGHGLGTQRSAFKMQADVPLPEDSSCDSDGDSGIGLTGTSQLGFETNSFPWSTEGQADERQGAIAQPPSDSVEASEGSFVDIRSKVAGLVREITACVPEARMDDTTCLSDFGVDSLSATELQARVKEIFHVDFPLRKCLEKEALTLGRLCQEIQSGLSALPGTVTKASSSSSRLNITTNVVDGFTYPQTQPCPAEPASQEDQGRPEADKELKSRLSSLLAEHLNLPAESPLDPLAPLGDMGLDSLVAIQLKSDMLELFGKPTSGKPLQLGPETTFQDLCSAIRAPSSIQAPSGIASRTSPKAPPVAHGESSLVSQAPAELQRVNDSYGLLAHETRWAGFYASGAHQEQLDLVVAYIAESFSALGCDLAALQADEQLPAVSHLPKYQKLTARLHDILREAGLIELSDGREYRRTTKPLPGLAGKLAEDMYGEILRALPNYSPEHQLLHVTAPHLAGCLSGKKDPLELLFSDRAAKQLLTDVYAKAPLFATGNRLLGEFLGRAVPHHKRSRPSEKLRVLEIGGGTGGTTHLVLQKLIECGADFAYTFTDISAGLVAATRRAMATRYGAGVAGRMDWAVLNVEEAPPARMRRRFDLVVSANCVHATRDLRASCANIRGLLRPEGGVLCLLELTRPQPWLDCVFGLLDGWWRFEDGRTYALADERQWDRILRGAGFFHVGWSDDESRESDQLRLITALSRDSDST